MSATDLPAVPGPSDEEVAAAMAARAREEHQAALAELHPAHEGALARIDELRAHLLMSIEKAGNDPGHVGYAASFVRDVDLKLTEIDQADALT